MTEKYMRKFSKWTKREHKKKQLYKVAVKIYSVCIKRTISGNTSGVQQPWRNLPLSFSPPELLLF